MDVFAWARLSACRHKYVMKLASWWPAHSSKFLCKDAKQLVSVYFYLFNQELVRVYYINMYVQKCRMIVYMRPLLACLLAGLFAC